MVSLKGVLLLCLVGLTNSMNLNKAKHENVLYFQAHEEDLDTQAVVTLSNGSCPNNTQYFCSTNYTCCKANPSSKVPFVCCTFSEGVCCPDGMHCCPRGTFCDMPNRRCFSKNQERDSVTIQNWNTMLYGHLKFKSAEKAEVTCNDGSQCPYGSTCCQLASGSFGCCPLVQATCCDDHVHCCPNGYKCDLSAGTCVRGNHVLSLFTKQPAKNPPIQLILNDTPNSISEKSTENTLAESVVCPGGQSQCPDGTTCCRMQSGDYGCCPYPKAVCCSDGLHCCPNGYKCDVAQGECKHGADRVQWVAKVLAKTREEVTCNDGSSCPQGSTCCQLASGSYGCCPLPQAVCCDDHVHCCPNGYTCDVSAGTCNKGNDIVAWLTKQPAKTVVNDVPCDDTSSCPDGNTCCKLASGQYGCCPLPKAVCCDDHVHCCPNGYTCDVSAGTCNRGNDIVAWLTKQPAKTVVTDVPCDDTSSCPDGNTCCKLASGDYGCCPLPKAVCCDDHVHCCPNGYTCDVSAGTCNRGNDIVAWLTKQPAKTVVNDVPCDDTSSCPNGNTCCKLASGQYGCCPLPKAVCCDDHVHCCPNGYTCDVSAGTCNRGNDIVAWLTKQPAKTVVSEVKCDDTASCPDGTTCCKLASGQFGCCPLPSAVCCDDHVHCCPNGYTCDVSAGTCNKGNDIVAWLTKQPAKTVVNDVPCDDTSSCPNGNTCCKLASGQYGCCPLPKAECCDDHVHCCPNGYTCDVSAGTCNRGNDIVAWLTKQPAKTVVTDVPCDDTSSCPDGNTCCKLASGDYGCCPLPKAVCCDDHVHCCPNGYTCDVSAGTCNKGNDIVAWLTKQPAKTVVNDVPCDDTSSCPNGNTCCKLASGQYGCCPLPKAVCCDDHVHCCPNSYTCDVSAGTCNRGNDIVAWLTKQPAKSVVNDVPCDDTSSCPDGNTCCKLASGQYGCCPLPKAVCCDDHVHCCPNGYTCDVSAGTCNRGNDIVAWLTKQPAKTVVNDVPCDDTSSCPNGNTCCKLASGQYGCCPLPKAVCCDDHVHCCPNSYTCDVSAGTCNRGNDIVAWLTKQPAKSVVNDVPCDDTSSCPDGNTCCKLASGQYGCCPLPKAVCCDDHVHCCPNGYTCDVSAGTCNRGNDIVAWLTKQPAKTVVNDVPCDDTSSCPNGNTCCKLASGQYGCCPLPKAVCCDDHVHCCPNGYTCDVSAGTCNRGNELISWFTKIPAKSLL